MTTTMLTSHRQHDVMILILSRLPKGGLLLLLAVRSSNRTCCCSRSLSLASCRSPGGRALQVLRGAARRGRRGGDRALKRPRNLLFGSRRRPGGRFRVAGRGGRGALGGQLHGQTLERGAQGRNRCAASGRGGEVARPGHGRPVVTGRHRQN